MATKPKRPGRTTIEELVSFDFGLTVEELRRSIRAGGDFARKLIDALARKRREHCGR